MLSVIVIVTVSAPDLNAAQTAYEEYLSYNVIETGQVPEALAAAWNTPNMAGRNYVVMQPASKAEVFLRFVESPAVEGFAAMRTFGWNSNEILVEDPDAMAKRLENSPFRIIGEPKNLSTNENIRAMQAIGPAGEVIYLTRIPADGGGFNLGSAETFVDRTFIVVVGGPDIDAMRRFYNEVFAMPVTAPVDARISVLSNAHGMASETRHKLAVARLPTKFLIEIDQYPDAATTRPQRFGELPPGMSMVGFQVASFAPIEERLLAPPRTVDVAPYRGRRVAVLQGAAGELIELIEEP